MDTEMQLGRDVSTSTAVVGYAGGKENTKSTCYYYNAPDTLYEKQGHAEVVQVGIDSAKAAEQFGAFSETYFSQFQKTRFGMIRLVRLFAAPQRMVHLFSMQQYDCRDGATSNALPHSQLPSGVLHGWQDHPYRAAPRMCLTTAVRP